MTETFPLILLEPHTHELATWAEANFPNEVCGLILGKKTSQGFTATAVTHAKNLNTERTHDRFELDPDDFHRADIQARQHGAEIIGIWHTHPDHPAVPSETDLKAAWDGYSYLIIRVTKEKAEDFRSWRLKNKQFEEETLLIKKEHLEDI